MPGELSPELVALISFLLPGFVGAWVFYNTSGFRRPGGFERIVQAVVFTALARAPISLVQVFTPEWPGGLDLFLGVFLGAAVGLIAGWGSNTDWLLGKLRDRKMTQRSSRPSNWYSSFYCNETSWVVLSLTGERRLMAWVEDFPTECDSGHFVLNQARWLVEDDESGDQSEVMIDGAHRVVVPATMVEMVEFLDSEGNDPGEEGAEDHRGSSKTSPQQAAQASATTA